MYARAREDLAEYQAGEIVKIADNQELDPQSRRVMVDARKWISCRRMPPCPASGIRR